MSPAFHRASLAAAIGAGRPDWHEMANCRGLDPEMFFPERGESTGEAKAVCCECPVQGECLDHALVNTEKFGIWGGLSERQRRTVRHARREEAS